MQLSTTTSTTEHAPQPLICIKVSIARLAKVALCFATAAEAGFWSGSVPPGLGPGRLLGKLCRQGQSTQKKCKQQVREPPVRQKHTSSFTLI
eukprot:3941351-Rhodomonas_salina.1